MAFHALWFIAFLMIAVPIVVIVLIVTLSGGGQHQHRTPLFSPDGRWWWDGRQWQPVPRPPDAIPPAPPSAPSAS